MTDAACAGFDANYSFYAASGKNYWANRETPTGKAFCWEATSQCAFNFASSDRLIALLKHVKAEWFYPGGKRRRGAHSLWDSPRLSQRCDRRRFLLDASKSWTFSAECGALAKNTSYSMTSK